MNILIPAVSMVIGTSAPPVASSSHSWWAGPLEYVNMFLSFIFNFNITQSIVKTVFTSQMQVMYINNLDFTTVFS